MRKACNSCSTKKPIPSNSSWISALLIIILPKCPFCVMAYSSAITMCGTSSLYMTGNNWVSFIPLGLSVMIIFTILFNWRDNRTLWSLIIASVGLALILGAHQLIVPAYAYDWGTGLMFMAIFYNGPFFSLVVQCKQFITDRYESRFSNFFKRINHLS